MKKHEVKLVNPELDVLYPFIKELNPDLEYGNSGLYLKEMVKNGFLVAGAFLNDAMVGITGIWLSTKFYSGKYLEIDSFVVKESFRGAGIGEEIISFCINFTKKNYCKMIVLNAYIENEKAHFFYDKLGFKKTGIHRTLII